MDIKDRLEGAVWGHLIGDALGVPYEFKDATQIATVEWRGYGTHNQPAGTWSDDGALMLATLASLLREREAGHDRFDTTDQAKRFLAWRDDGAYIPDGDGRFDIGNATSSAISRFKQGTMPELSGGTDEGSQGNGSLMRILPIALVERDLEDRLLIGHAQRSSRITHAHPVPLAACALYVLLARDLLRGQSRAEALENARTVLRARYQNIAAATRMAAAMETIEGWAERSGRGYVVDSFWSAWDAFAEATDYREAVERAIKYGNDADTTACIAGGLAGIYWGADGIPAEWRAGLRGKAIVDPLISALATTPTEMAPAAPPNSHTSETHPIRVDQVDPSDVPASAGWTGKLGMTFLPGKTYQGRTARHWRDLHIDGGRLTEQWGIDTLVLLVEDEELAMTRTEGVVEQMRRHGIDVIRYPIKDVSVPTNVASLRELLSLIEARVRNHKYVTVACLGGLGRTGTVVGCLLRDVGLSGPDAVALTRKSRRGAIETREQEAFVLNWQPGAGR